MFVPAQNRHGFFDFTPWVDGVEIAWDYDQAYNSLKRYFLPPREDLVAYNRKTYEAKSVMEAPKQLFFGVHPYDVKAINQLDQLMEQGAPDQNYLLRRENTVIFAMDPIRIAPTAFWSSVGADKVDLGYDLYWTKISANSFYVEVGSRLGEDLLLCKGRPPEATLPEREAARRAKTRIKAQADKRGLSFPWKETPRLLARSWNADLWRHKATHCLSCGSCVMVCPTCYCFEVRDEADVNLETGKKYREWHGCMLPSFQLVAGGHNFQPEAMDRYRHRYFRKGKYIFDRLGELGCVGCGRCVRACTAGIANPMAVYNELWDAEQRDPLAF